MTAEIKRMLAEKVHAEMASPPPAELPAEDEALLARIDIAAPYIDAGCVPLQWPPSGRLKILFFVLSTGPGGSTSAHRCIERLLEKARRRWVAGEHPNPFSKEPKLRNGEAR